MQEKRVKILCLFLLFLISSVQASYPSEKLNITTYYPSPYGEYRQLRVRGNTYLGTTITSGHVGIGTTSPGVALAVSGNFNTGKQTESQLTYAGQVAIVNNTAPQIDFIDTDHNDWAIHVNGNYMYFIRSPWEYAELIIDGAGNVGIGTGPSAKLHVAGTAQFDGDVTGLTLDCTTVTGSSTSTGAGWKSATATCASDYVLFGCGDGSTFSDEHWGRYVYPSAADTCTAGVWRNTGTASVTYYAYARCCRIR
ncbi:MAG: hypothetical protein WC510_05490 [Candidatus Omnitrophota bacterium]